MPLALAGVACNPRRTSLPRRARRPGGPSAPAVGRQSASSKLPPREPSKPSCATRSPARAPKAGRSWSTSARRGASPASASIAPPRRGELDGDLSPQVTLLEFDLDRDRERLVSAGYVSKYIPLFALPGPDGKASGKQIEGGIKGDGAVGFIVPRLKEMLAE